MLYRSLRLRPVYGPFFRSLLALGGADDQTVSDRDRSRDGEQERLRLAGVDG